MVKPLHIVLAVVAAALTAGAFLLFDGQEKTGSAQVTSTTVASGSPGWTEEEMRDARGQDMTAGPSVEVLVAGGALLAGATTAAVVRVARRRSSSR